MKITHSVMTALRFDELWTRGQSPPPIPPPTDNICLECSQSLPSAHPSVQILAGKVKGQIVFTVLVPMSISTGKIWPPVDSAIPKGDVPNTLWLHKSTGWKRIAQFRY